MNNIKPRIQEDMKAAMRAKEEQRLGTIRLLMAAIKQREVDERISLDDAQIIAVIDKMIKQRQESINQFQTAGRMDLVEKEQAEIIVLQNYLPPALSDNEINAMIKQVINDTSAKSMQDMGKVMAQLKPKLQGRADMGKVSQQIKALLES